MFCLFPFFLYTLLLQHCRVLLNKPHTNSWFAASHTTAFSTLTWDSSCIPASLITREAKERRGHRYYVCVHSAWDLDRKKKNHIFLVPQCFYRLLPSLQPSRWNCLWILKNYKGHFHIAILISGRGGQQRLAEMELGQREIGVHVDFLVFGLRSWSRNTKNTE